jgi:hypothetical protein
MIPIGWLRGRRSGTVYPPEWNTAAHHEDTIAKKNSLNIMRNIDDGLTAPFQIRNSSSALKACLRSADRVHPLVKYRVTETPAEWKPAGASRDDHADN